MKVTNSLPKVVTRGEWLVARNALLIREKAATRARDALNAERRLGQPSGIAGRRFAPPSDFNSDFGVTTNEGETFGLSVTPGKWGGKVPALPHQLFKLFFASRLDWRAMDQSRSVTQQHAGAATK